MSGASAIVFGVACFAAGFVFGWLRMWWRVWQRDEHMGRMIRACLASGATRHLERLANSLTGDA